MIIFLRGPRDLSSLVLRVIFIIFLSARWRLITCHPTVRVQIK